MSCSLAIKYWWQNQKLMTPTCKSKTIHYALVIGRTIIKWHRCHQKKNQLNAKAVFAIFHALCVLKWSFSLLKCYSRRWIASASCRNIRIKEFSSGSLEASWLGIAACICCVLFISHWSDLTIITDKSPLGSSTFDITYLKINNRQEYEKENYQYLRK